MKTLLPIAASRVYARISFLSIASLLIGLGSPAVAQVVLDSDSDGLLDSWEVQHFGSLSHPDGAPGANPDGDSCTNLEESHAGTDPNDAADCFVLASMSVDPSTLEVSWNTVLGTRYQVQLSDDLDNWVAISDSSGTTPLNFFGTGGLVSIDFDAPGGPVVGGGATREVWYHGDPTGSVANLKTHIDNGGSPLPADGTEWRSSLKGPSNYGDRYGDRWTGYIVPETTGNYNFYIAGRHQCEFSIDTTGDTADGNELVRVSYLNDGNLTEEEDWDYLASQGATDTQKSQTLALTAGQRYAFEIYHNHQGQWDHLAVGWEHNGDGNIEVVPGEVLQPAGDFLNASDYGDNNAMTLFAGSTRKFVRILAFSPLHAEALDSDGDGVADSVENVLAGYQMFRSESAQAGQSDGLTLTAAGQANPTADVVTVATTDPLAREDNGTIGSGLPRIKDVMRFAMRRSGSLAPQTVFFNLNGAADPLAKGDPDQSDYIVETPDGEVLVPAGSTYAVTIPFGGTEAKVELRAVLDEIVEYPEEVNLVLQTAADYTVGAPSQGTGDIHDARDDAEYNKYYIATFSKDDAAVTATSASGSTLLVLNGSNTIATVNDFFENLTSAQTNTHIHKATLDPDGVTLRAGPIVESITDTGEETGSAILGPVSNYTYLIEPRGGFSVQDIIDSLEFDNPKQGNPIGTTPLYNNKHTANNGAGEIWAIYQRRPASELSPETDGRIPPTPPIEPIDPVAEEDKLRREVARFFAQATFGPTEADIEEMIYQIVNVHGGDRIAAYDAVDHRPVGRSRRRWCATSPTPWTCRSSPCAATSTRPATAPPPPRRVAPANWPSWPSQDISDFDSLQVSTWQSPDADFPLTAQQENQLDGILGSPNHNNRRRAQWTIMANAEDQLRQRAGFALSEILVVSEQLNNIRQHHIAAARWIDMLAENADDHYREAIEDVTYSPIMGKYLSHLQNSSEDSSGVPPDENYAREIMQLFTIGLFELWDDGFVKLDPTQWNLLPTYNNDDIKELARVMTGMSWSTNSAARTNWDNPNIDRDIPPINWYDDGNGNLWYSSRFNYPMAFYSSGTAADNRHDKGLKNIFLDPGTGTYRLTINNPGNGNDGRYVNAGDKDLRDVHNYLAGTQNSTTSKSFASSWSTDPFVNHQSTPAFVCRRLIQRLVTSNPSGPYLYRVVQVWRNTNGQLDDVIRAILLDPEARNLSSELSPEFGKKKEPIVAWIQALRAAGSRSRITFDGSIIPGDPVDFPGQTHAGGVAPTADADLRNFDYPQAAINGFMGLPSYDSAGQLVPSGTGTYARLPGTFYRLGALDGGGTSALGQSPLRAPTVFNWFLPDYQPGGLIASYGLFAPEFQLATESSVFQNVNSFWAAMWNTNGFGGNTLGGNNSNSDLAGYSTTFGTGTNHSDDNIIPNYWVWINRYANYPTDPDNGLTNEGDRDLQLINDIDNVLTAGRFQLLYPIDASDDGTPGTQGALAHYPTRNPRETLLYYLTDTYGTSENAVWNKTRAAFYMMTTSPEFLIQK